MTLIAPGKRRPGEPRCDILDLLGEIVTVRPIDCFVVFWRPGLLLVFWRQGLQAQSPDPRGPSWGLCRGQHHSSVHRLQHVQPGVPDLFGPQEKGGIGNNGPAIVGDNVRIGNSAARTMRPGRSSSGPLFLPELSAEASATPGIGPHAGFSADGAYFFTAAAPAHVLTNISPYIGRTPSTYTIHFGFRGDAQGAHADDEPFVTISGTIALFDDRDRSGEF